jgi:hypothetical protein
MITDTDLNGYSEKDLGAAETLETVNKNVYLFFPTTPCATNGNQLKRVTFDMTQANDFVWINYCFLRHYGLTMREAATGAYIRFLAVQGGLVSPNFVQDDYFVKYSECVYVREMEFKLLQPKYKIPREKAKDESNEDYKAYTELIKEENKRIEEAYEDRKAKYEETIANQGPYIEQNVVTNLVKIGDDWIDSNRLNTADFSDLYAKEHEDFPKIVTPEDKKYYRDAFVDLVCIVAWMFRSRGHHYLQEFDTTYNRVWTKCLRLIEDVDWSWQVIATTLLHAIYPIVLDEFWLTATQKRFCSGALTKRINCAPAGIAFLFSLRSGLTDICSTFPAFRDQHKDLVDLVQSEYETYLASRWIGSINCRYYGVTRRHIDENVLIGLAAIIRSTYKEFVPQSNLLQSRSLERLADNAPVTGQVIGIILKAVSKSEGYVKAYIEHNA